MFRHLVSIGLFLILGLELSGQSAAQLNALCKKSLKAQPDSAIWYADKALSVALPQNDYSQIAWAYKNKGLIQFKLKNKEKAAEWFDKALPFFEKAQNWEEAGNLNHNLGLIHQKMGHFQKSATFYKKAISTKEQHHILSDLGDTYNGLAVLYQDFSQFDSSQYYLRKAFKLTVPTDTSDLAFLYNNMGRNFAYLNSPDSAMLYYQKSLSLKNMLADSLSIAVTIENIGQVYGMRSEFDTAFGSYYAALKIYEALNDVAAQARINNNIGSLYQSLRDTVKSIKYYQQSLKLYHQTKDEIGKARVYNNIGTLHEQQNRFDLAQQYYLKAAKIFLEEQRPRELGETYRNLSNIAKFKNNLQEAVYYLKKSNQIATQHNLVGAFFKNSYALAEIFQRQKNYTQGIEQLQFLNKAEYQPFIDDETYLASSALLAVLYAKTNQYQKAYETLDLHTARHKKYLTEQLYKAVTEVNAKYQNEKIEQENELYRKQARIDKLKAEQQADKLKTNKTIISIVLGFLILTLMVLVILYRINIARKKANAELVKKNIIISEQNVEIEQQLEMLAIQKHMVETQREALTDSINYAKRFQTAIVTSEQQLKTIFDSMFVWYLPRDIVSGDFYLATQKGDYKYFITADCTGHGVPGAFLSIIGHNGFNAAFDREMLSETDEILNFVNQFVYRILHQNEQNDIKDGIDLSIVRIDERNKTISFSGANHALFLVSDDGSETLKTDKISLGTYEDFKYQKFELIYKLGHRLYTYTDGYPDQFGGPKNKKLLRAQLHQILMNTKHLPVPEQKLEIEKAFWEWKGDEPQIDDVLVCGIELK